jgi:hypothetical protein
MKISDALKQEASVAVRLCCARCGEIAGPNHQCPTKDNDEVKDEKTENKEIKSGS